MTDINVKLLEAFKVEHIEHLEGIRACLAAWEQAPDAMDVDEAFRRAHSLKGASRIMGFAPVASLAHGLESLFSMLRAKTLSPSTQVWRVVRCALDAMEDAAATLMAGGEPGESTRAAADLEALIHGGAAPARPPRSAALKQRLREAFEEEYRSHLDAIVRTLQQSQQSEGGPDRIDVDEAFRCANSLKGAARLAELPTVEQLAQRLEKLFGGGRPLATPLDASAIDLAGQLLVAIEEAASNAAGAGPTPFAAAALRAADQVLNVAAAESANGRDEAQPSPSLAVAATTRVSGATSSPPIESVRLSADSLDRLLQSTGQLLTENLQQESLGRELIHIGRQIAAIEREWDTLKRTASGPLRRLASSPDLSGVSRYVDFVEHEIHALSRRVRSVRLLQQRSAWTVRLLSEQLQEDVRRTRMVPVESEFQPFRKLMRDLAREEAKEIDFRVTGFDVLADRMVLQALKDPLMHVLNNAVSHGLELPAERIQRGKPPAGVVTLDIRSSGNRLAIMVEDDGRGVDLGRVSEIAIRRGLLTESEAATRAPQELARLLFQPGFSTSRTVTEVSGRGMGLSAVYEAVSRLQGEVELRPRDQGGTVLALDVPLSISTHRMLLVSCRGQTFAVPSYGIEGLHRAKLADIEHVEGKPMAVFGGQLTPLTSLAHLLDHGAADTGFEADVLWIAVLRSGAKRVAVAVDAFVAERSALIKSLGPPADRLAHFVGGVLLEDGSVAPVLNPAELVDRFRSSRNTAAFRPGKPAAEPRPPTILVVDDSFTTRTLETSILETNGYRVRVAVDGVEALEQLRAEKMDLVISDIQMPRLDGFGLLEEMKRDSRLSRVPVIVVSSIDRREDQERGLSLGADAYIVKRKFDHQELLQTIRQIL